MKKIAYLFTGIIIGSTLITGCEAVKNTNSTQRGAVLGAAVGAAAGAILGNNVGKGGKGVQGAVIGGVAGGVAGGLIGKKMDKQKREIETALPGAEVERVGDGIKLTLGENSVNFEFAKSSLTAQAKANLDKLVPVFNEYKDTNIAIFGHTDSVGSDQANLKLSEQRAESVKSYLVSKGLIGSRFVVTGVGEAEPIADNETKEGQAKNRRVEFAIVANEKMIQDAEREAGQ